MPQPSTIVVVDGRYREHRHKLVSVVRDLDGNLLDDRMVGHEFRFENGLIQRFDIGDARMPRFE